ncbi:MAG: AMP-dependent synthetase/ligase [Acidimicrobiales bacterium]
MTAASTSAGTDDLVIVPADEPAVTGDPTRQATLPAMLAARASAAPARTALRHHHQSVWRTITWSDYAARSARVGQGLRALGVTEGDRIAVHSENRPEWLFADIGGQGIGAVPVGVYPTSPAGEVEYLLGHSEAKVLIAEDEEQLDKALEVRDRLPHLRHIVVIDANTVLHHLDDPMISTFADLEALGAGHEGAWFAGLERLDPDAPALIVYTSGTTGPPKGAVLSHANLVAAAASFSQAFDSTQRDEVLSYLPLCHIAERLSSAINALWVGYVVNFGRGGPFFANDLRDVQPTIFLGVPRVWEKMAATVEIRMSDASGLKRSLYHRSVNLGRRLARDRMDGRYPLTNRFLGRLLWVVVFRALREKLGLRRVRIAISGAAPIAPQLLEYFWAIGVPVTEGYGQTENTAVATSTPIDDVRLGKVGKALPGVEISIADNGEILTRSAANFIGYLKDPEATAETIDAEGWLHTGDVGELDAAGFLTITDRVKDLIITAGGKNISPSEIENHLKVSPYVKEAVVIGDGRKYLIALIGIEYDTVGDWAARKEIPYTTYGDLSSKPEVVDLVDEWVDHVNRELARVEQIKAFRLLPTELDHEGGQLTATQKVKRRAVEDAFPDLIEEAYR